MYNFRDKLAFALVALGVTWSTPTLAGGLVELARTPKGQKVEFIEAFRPLADEPTKLLFATQNRGAECGDGSPVTVYEVNRDASSGSAISIGLNDTLDEVQTTRLAFFHGPDGTLFTGGGWCGFKPPYYSTDAGKSFDPATRGVSPPNSTFSFAALRGQVYAGTGYDPYPAEIYRWLGTSGADFWERVLQLDPPRTILSAMAVHNDRLFAGSVVYYYNGAKTCASTVPVLVSGDGRSFHPTRGIPGCQNIAKLLKVGGKLVAWTVRQDGELYSTFVWNAHDQRWRLVGKDNFGRNPAEGRLPALLVAFKCALIAYGVVPGQTGVGLFVSHDIGRSWRPFLRVPSGPGLTALEVNGDELLAGTYGDAAGVARVYTARFGQD